MKNKLILSAIAFSTVLCTGCGGNHKDSAAKAKGDDSKTNDKYRVTLYSGGRPTREWVVAKYDEGRNGYKFKDNRTGDFIEVAGCVVVEPYKKMQFAARPVIQGVPTAGAPTVPPVQGGPGMARPGVRAFPATGPASGAPTYPAAGAVSQPLGSGSAMTNAPEKAPKK